MSLTTDTHSLPFNAAYFVYIMANDTRKLFYIGVTGFLVRKMKQHAGGTGYEDGNASSHECTDLVYVEQFEQAGPALEREQRLRNWGHAKIEALINTQNPDLKALNEELGSASSALL